MKIVEHLVKPPEQSIRILRRHQDADVFDNEFFGSSAACRKDRGAARQRFRHRDGKRFCEAGKDEQISLSHELPPLPRLALTPWKVTAAPSFKSAAKR